MTQIMQKLLTHSATAAPNGGASIPGPPPTPSVPSGATGSMITSRQRIEVDVFDRHPRAMLAVLTATPLGLAHALPIGRPVAGALKPFPFDKRFQPPQAMPILLPPVPINSPGHPAQHMAGQVGHPHPGQDQKSSVVGNLPQPLRPLLAPPPQGPVPGRAAPSRRPEEQAGQFSPTMILDQIADIFPPPAAAPSNDTDPNRRPTPVAPLCPPLLSLASAVVSPSTPPPKWRLLPVPPLRHSPPKPTFVDLQPGQPNLPLPFQFEQKTPSGKILQPPTPVPPLPLQAKFTGQPLTAPVRMKNSIHPRSQRISSAFTKRP